MKKHTKIYFQYYGYGEQDCIICEGCESERAVDIHHLEARGMGGSKTKDSIENLIALCRSCHTFAEQDKKFNNQLKKIKQLKTEG